MHNSGYVPARDMSQKPSVQHRQVTPSARVFHQQDRSQGTFQDEAIQEGPLRDRCFTKNTGKLPQIQDTLLGLCHQSTRWSQA